MTSLNRYINPIYQRYVKSIVVEARKKTENLTDNELRQIVQRYDSASRLHKLRRFLFPEGACFEENLTYSCAVDLLLGRFSWIGEDWDEALRENADWIERRKEEWIRKGERVELFPGNLQDYERLKGCEYIVIDNCMRDKSMFYDCCRNTCLELGRLGVEALVEATGHPAGVPDYYKGIPVRRKPTLTQP